MDGQNEEHKRLNASNEPQEQHDGAAAQSKVVRILTADQILDAEDIGIEQVEVPEWGGIVYVRAMTAVQRERYLDSMRKVIGEGAKATIQTVFAFGSAKLAVLTLCDQNGALLFDRKPETVERLARKSAKAMERVVAASAKLNGLDDEDEKKKAAEKNASAVPMETNDGSAID